ncbi:hypothetical protein BLS_009988 [Venturia inaequalis]|uniref:Thioesterase domain-containing protein n=1 Tax=Venturia inaequalis TaxID=5025 RepID=A0A8H3Z108_VENIN|nr:hypothetical protein BLS_009988 [Venturia inaequalis]
MLPLRPQLRASALLRPRFARARSPILSRTIPPRFAYTTTTTTAPKRGSARPYIIGVAFVAVGALIGAFFTAVIRPPPFPEAGSDEDAYLLGRLVDEIDNLPIVKKLRRGKTVTAGSANESLHRDTAIIDDESELLNNGEDEEWIELTVSFDRSNTMLNGMLGFGKIGIQRAFWQPATKEIVMVIWYGGALTGWPGIAHGGCTATFLIEGLGKVVNCVNQLGDSSKGESITPPDPSSLSLTYLRPIKANSIYIMRAQMAEMDSSAETSLPPQKDLTKKQRDERSSITHRLNKKYEVNGTIENLEGKLHVKASAVWDIL